MRSWIVAASSFGAVAMMTHVDSSLLQAQMPANAKSAPPFSQTCIGCFALWPDTTFPLWKPSAGI